MNAAAGGGSPLSVRPVFAKVPTATTEACAMPSAEGYPTALAGADAHPVRVVAVWHPGFKATSCATVVTQGDAAEAAELALSIDQSAQDTGDRNCIDDFGVGVSLYFTYSDGQTELINVSFSGCGDLGAPQRFPRYSDKVRPELRPLTPPSYSRWTSQ